MVCKAVYAAHNKRGQRRERRQGAAAGCALYALRGRAAADTDKHWLVCKAVYAAHNKRGKRRERRQGAAAECARQCPSGGRVAAGTGEHWLVFKTIYAVYK